MSVTPQARCPKHPCAPLPHGAPCVMCAGEKLAQADRTRTRLMPRGPQRKRAWKSDPVERAIAELA